ncbi:MULTISPECIES: DUF881 domain-containing protein [Dehalobacter]|jgi:uncharacterized protein YlxW (UPF0749 family)|uniref:DUF881 domain-containing protein n=2 Tax=Dehalobacter restrictus TaxID=55583 RepID=A0A857DFV6_9FIRM|nr:MULTISPECIES: DUF881 domain-containing protein [Dehalobacter]AHF08896.1 hypothetical protein DEHRE_01055 [Dehalobacter restrictus DSM 9455]MCG1025708.1 DUF881 domain-containing protein [Dehalobacter sp.]MDJ0305478.1 DUF881 domain-containing protein [Dehalobacter sp.]OCZ50067.1 hypothetical protein A7D23_01655 [Dehalobacter sp. TeCB1]QGZ99391.1 DUF881 domain-containing protein [Dehalobacter restrictus]
MQDKKKMAWMMISVGMLLIGVFLVIIIKSYMADQNASSQEKNLPSLLQLEMENEQLAGENDKLLEELTKYQAGESAAALASEQLEQAKISAGLVSLSGPGIVIVLDDSDQKRSTSNGNIGNYYIHEEYLRAIVNALWNGGAEAISINDQRITSNTEIFCSGSYIKINNTRQMPPYNIVAIGNQDNLKSALQFYVWDMLGEYQQQYGITRKLEIPKESVTVPAANQYSYKYAQPVKEG